MQRHKRFLSLVALTAMVTAASAAQAQSLWKYTDKDGKVTYSDKAPKKGEEAQLVPSDPSANVIEAPKNVRGGIPQKLRDVQDRAAERERQRDNLLRLLEIAKTALESAKTALENGREPLAEEVQIVVGRTPAGAPTGANRQLRKPEYYTRLSALEDAVKKAEENVEIAERNFRRNAP